jgi:hypothetical protein
VPSGPEFILKTTSELVSDERRALSTLFSEVFQKPFPVELFESKYARTCLGRSFHCLMLVEGALAGAYSAIPVRYRFFGDERLFAIGVDLMIAKTFRGRLSHFKNLSEILYARLAAEGVAFVFGCARDEMRVVHEAVSKWSVAGRLHYYLAPLHLRYLGRATILLRSILRAVNLVTLFPPPPRRQPEIEKVNDDAFASYRYQMFPVTYRRVALRDGGTCVYTRDLFYPIEGLRKDFRLGILLDVDPLTRDHLENAVNMVRELESDLEVLAYQGYLPFQPRNMLRVPDRLERPAWFLAGRILLPNLVDERIFEISNWKINLSNGDLF